MDDENWLTSSFCHNKVKEIETEMFQVKEYDEKINDLMEQHELSICDKEYYNELDSQAE